MTSTGKSGEPDRYEKLMKDWSAEDEAGDEPSAAEEAPRARLGGGATPGHAPRFPNGTILCLNEEELVIYRRPVTGKPLDMVYSLIADGTAKIEAIDLNQQDVRTMGRLLPRNLKTLQSDLKWTRDLVASGCDDPEDAEMIPDPGAPDDEPSAAPPPPSPRPPAAGRPAPAPAPPSRPVPAHNRPSAPPPRPVKPSGAPNPGSGELRRGQRFIIQFGGKSWSAVFWGRDTGGYVVAHDTNGEWNLMHLDLDRYRETLVMDGEPDAEVVDDIIAAVRSRMAEGQPG